MRQFTCQVCESQFKSAAHTPVKYCSSACRAHAHKARMVARRRDRIASLHEAGGKRCPRCNSVQPLSMFRKDARRADGLYPYCISCWREYIGAKALKRAEHSKSEYNRRRYEKLKAVKGEAALRASHREGHLINRFNMTLEEYDLLLEAQDGRCAICKRTPAEVGEGEGDRYKALAVDHDHACCPGRGTSCGKCIRGLLCGPCNTALGALREDPQVLLSALTYLSLTAHTTSRAGGKSWPGSRPTQTDTGDAKSSNAS